MVEAVNKRSGVLFFALSAGFALLVIALIFLATLVTRSESGGSKDEIRVRTLHEVLDCLGVQKKREACMADTVLFEREYGTRFISEFIGVNFDCNEEIYLDEKYIRMDFWGPEKKRVVHSDREISGAGIFRSVTAAWEMPRVLCNGKNGLSDTVDYGQRCDSGSLCRKIEIELLRFRRHKADSNTENIQLTTLFRNKDKMKGFSRAEIEFSNAFFSEQICEVGIEGDNEWYIVNFYGAKDSIFVKMVLRHNNLSGSFKRSLEVAQNIWRSVRVLEWSL